MSDCCTCPTASPSLELPLCGKISLQLGACCPDGGALPLLPSYSTEEQFSGRCWIDGKKIYQKTFVFTGDFVKDKAYSYAHNLSGFHECVNLEGMSMDDAGYFRPFPYKGLTPGYDLGVYVQRDHVGIKCFTIDRNNFRFYLTMFYTCTDR